MGPCFMLLYIKEGRGVKSKGCVVEFKGRVSNVFLKHFLLYFLTFSLHPDSTGYIKHLHLHLVI